MYESVAFIFLSVQYRITGSGSTDEGQTEGSRATIRLSTYQRTNCLEIEQIRQCRIVRVFASHF